MDLLTRIWQLGLDEGPRWRLHPDLEPCAEAAYQWWQANRPTSTILDAVASDHWPGASQLATRRFLREVEWYLRTQQEPLRGAA